MSKITRTLAAALCAFCLFFAGCGGKTPPDDGTDRPAKPWPPTDGEVAVDWDNSWPENEAAADSDFTADNLVWQDEFNGNTIDETKWNFEIGNGSNGWGNGEKQYYRKENARVNGGKLQIMARYESYNGFDYTSARMTTKGKFSTKYGKIEARIKLPKGTGLWPAFWMMPEDSAYGDWPRSGELDIMEVRGRQETRSTGAVHYGVPHQYKNGVHYFDPGEDITGWHTYGAEWTRDKISLYVDGFTFLTVRSNVWFTAAVEGQNNPDEYAPYDRNFFLILNLAVGGMFDNYVMPETSSFGALMEVDYVRVFSLTA